MVQQPRDWFWDWGNVGVEDKDAGGGGDEADANVVNEADAGDVDEAEADAGDGAAEFFHLPSSSPLGLLNSSRDQIDDIN